MIILNTYKSDNILSILYLVDVMVIDNNADALANLNGIR